MREWGSKMSSNAEDNGSISAESEAGSEEDTLQRLQKDARDLREGLRLRRSRNVGPEGKQNP